MHVPGPRPLFQTSIVFAKSITMPHYKSVFCQQILENLGVDIWSLQNGQKLNDSLIDVYYLKNAKVRPTSLCQKHYSDCQPSHSCSVQDNTRESREDNSMIPTCFYVIMCCPYTASPHSETSSKTMCGRFLLDTYLLQKCFSVGWTAISSSLFTQSRQLFTLSFTLYTAPVPCFW